MEFKAGDRVHVTKLDNTKVNFYATLNSNPANPACFKLEDCSNSSHKEKSVWKIVTKGSCDYYTLATDEEDTEEPVIQRTTDTVNHPSHYNFGDIEVVDFIEQVTKHYNSDVAYHIGNAIKYISRAPHKNGKEDIAKAKWYIERAFDKWE